MTTHLSNSQLGDYVRCQKSYYLKRIAFVPQVPAMWLVGGSAVHAAIEAINRHVHQDGANS